MTEFFEKAIIPIITTVIGSFITYFKLRAETSTKIKELETHYKTEIDKIKEEANRDIVQSENRIKEMIYHSELSKGENKDILLNKTVADFFKNANENPQKANETLNFLKNIENNLNNHNDFRRKRKKKK